MMLEPEVYSSRFISLNVSFPQVPSAKFTLGLTMRHLVPKRTHFEDSDNSQITYE